MADLGEMYLESQRQPALPHDRLFGRLDSAHQAAVEWLRQLASGQLTSEGPATRHPTRAYRQRVMLGSVQNDPLLTGSWMSPQGERYSIPRSIIDYLSSAFAPQEQQRAAAEPYAPPDAWSGNIRAPAIRPDLPPPMAVEDYNRRNRSKR